MDKSTATVIELLAKNIKPVDICRMFDVSASAISQIATKYAENIAQVQADSKLSKLGTDAKLDELEDTLLGRMSTQIDVETDLRILASVYRIVNGAHRRGRGESPNGAVVNNVAQLHLHQNFIQQNVSYAKNAQGEIIQAGNKNLISASSNSVLEMANVTGADTLDEVTADDLFGPSN